MIIFDGYAFAQQKEKEITAQMTELTRVGIAVKIVAILFTEDAGSQLYTRLKKEAALRAGIAYEIFSFSILDPVEQVVSTVHTLNQDESVTGIIIQKPSKKRWLDVAGKTEAHEFLHWWSALVESISPQKDVDGLHPTTLQAVEQGNWREKGKVLPATAKAVLSILEEAKKMLLVEVVNQVPQDFADWKSKKYIIIGKSDILGKPLFYELRAQGLNVEMIGSKELQARKDAGQGLHDAEVIISATGSSRMIIGELIKPGVVIIDVGEPQPDVNFDSVKSKASFITPVPGGVGPVTVVSLLENAVEMVS